MALAGFTKICSKNTPGNSLLWLIEASKLNSVTITGDEVTAISTDATGDDFQVYEVDQDTLVRTEEGTGTGSNMSYIHAIEFSFSKPSAAMRTSINALADASPCGIVAIMRDGNGVYWLVGYNATDLASRGLKLVSDTMTTGTAPDDEEGSKDIIRLETKSGFKAVPLDATPSATGPTILA